MVKKEDRRSYSFYMKIGQLVCFCCFIAAAGCQNGERIPDVSNINVTLHTQRMDKDLAGLDTSHIGKGLTLLNKKYPDFLNFYLDTLMGFRIYSNYNDSAIGIREGLRVFLTNKDYRGVFDTVAKHYPDTKKIDDELTSGFKYMKYYFPQSTTPNVVYLVTGLNNWGAFTFGSSTVAIGLDMFLGANYPFYRSVGLPDYLDTHLRPNYIPVAVFSTLYQDSHPFLMEDHNLLDMMIQKGKQQYYLHKVLPHTADTTLFGYTKAQLDWCNDNEGLIFNFFGVKNLFYEKEFEKIMRYINEGPNSTGMPSQSPGNIGTWLGWRIVSAYMKKHPDVTLAALGSNNEDPQRFLEGSGYKPK